MFRDERVKKLMVEKGYDQRLIRNHIAYKRKRNVVEPGKYHLYDFTRRYLGRFQIEWSYV